MQSALTTERLTLSFNELVKIMKFLDQARVYIKSGKGGNGCLSFRREKFIQFGGPDGGNGGKGGNVLARCVDNLNTLVDYRYQQHFFAKTGTGGSGRNRNGAKGEDSILLVPPGTQVFAEDNETLLADLTEPGQEATLAKGGNGGFGNSHFKSSTNQAPRRTNPGLDGEELTIWLRLKLIADAGLIGLPNAGKSTFLSAVSAANPKIANYPFTTIHPNLGVVKIGNTDFVIADLPGLIEGANEGIGLGTRFLGHAERCRVVIHFIDCGQDDVEEAYTTIRNELIAYGGDLEHKPEILVLSKSDTISEDDVGVQAEILKDLTGREPLIISAVTHSNTDAVLYATAKIIDSNMQKSRDEKLPPKEPWTP